MKRVLSAIFLVVAARCSPVCQEGYDNKAPDLNGGPIMLAVDDPALCRSLCEDHELCGAFVHHTRAHGCLPVNHDTNTSHTNLPPLWPAAQCFLKAPGAASVAPVADASNCSCASRCLLPVRHASRESACAHKGLAHGRRGGRWETTRTTFYFYTEAHVNT